MQAKYQFLETIGTLPKMVDTGLQYLGIKEFVGKQVNNPIIMNMAKQMNVLHIYNNDETAWCSLFIAFVARMVGKPVTFKDYEILRAASWATWGNEVKKEDVQLGDIVVLKRPGGNHVGIAIAISKNADGKIGSIHLLGGNQGNSVTIAEMPINRVSNVRRYYSVAAPDSAKQYVIDSSGVMSVNEV